jgi:hypothetical protein
MRPNTVLLFGPIAQAKISLRRAPEAPSMITTRYFVPEFLRADNGQV